MENHCTTGGRKGVSLKREPRQIEVQDLNLKPVTKMKEIEIEISCTKGTFYKSVSSQRLENL
ncbi:MAG: hypothetical protein CM1200mP12_12630 [Gammaproteobacteria bacterium]|nr:MAG: hypothetical protein CM1200mP12_12630 [Gammaproteobacteria bacterium]